MIWLIIIIIVEGYIITWDIGQMVLKIEDKLEELIFEIKETNEILKRIEGNQDAILFNLQEEKI